MILIFYNVQILGISLSHPEDLGSFDHELHKGAVTWVLENSVESLDLPFSIDVINPWNKVLVTIPLDDKDVDKILDDSNKASEQLNHLLVYQKRYIGASFW